MREILLTFVQNLLENNRIPVHFVALPCADVPWMDCGLRADILPDYAPDSVQDYLNRSGRKQYTTCGTLSSVPTVSSACLTAMN